MGELELPPFKSVKLLAPRLVHIPLRLLDIITDTVSEIYATVGNEAKVNYLMETYGLSRDRIFNPRSASFKTDLMRVTAGRGVDIVLNSLSGNLLHASWQCVAKFGRMIELGKRDFIGHGVLDMSVFESNRTFVGVDLAQIGKEAPEILKRLVLARALVQKS